MQLQPARAKTRRRKSSGGYISNDEDDDYWCGSVVDANGVFIPSGEQAERVFWIVFELVAPASGPCQLSLTRRELKTSSPRFQVYTARRRVSSAALAVS